MANYIARVELHLATYEDYEELHNRMRQQGFARMIRGNDGKDYHLPTGTYVMRNSNVPVRRPRPSGQRRLANGQEVIDHCRRLGRRNVERALPELTW